MEATKSMIKTEIKNLINQTYREMGEINGRVITHASCFEIANQIQSIIKTLTRFMII